jgi:hydrogenase maturation protease
VNCITAPQPAQNGEQGTAKSIGVLVLGLGNVLLGDDGLGAAAVAQLERDYRVPGGVRLADGGTLGLALLDLLAEAEHVVLVDAVRTGRPPGTLVRLDGADVADAVRDRLSPHQVGVADLLDAARLIDSYPASVVLLGLVPESIDLAVTRSNAVAGGLDELTAAIVGEVQSLGYKMERDAEACSRHRPINDLTRHFGM